MRKRTGLGHGDRVDACVGRRVEREIINQRLCCQGQRLGRGRVGRRDRVNVALGQQTVGHAGLGDDVGRVVRDSQLTVLRIEARDLDHDLGLVYRDRAGLGRYDRDRVKQRHTLVVAVGLGLVKLEPSVLDSERLAAGLLGGRVVGRGAVGDRLVDGQPLELCGERGVHRVGIDISLAVEAQRLRDAGA